MLSLYVDYVKKICLLSMLMTIHQGLLNTALFSTFLLSWTKTPSQKIHLGW